MRDPIVLRFDQPEFFAGRNFRKLLVNLFAESFFLAPEIIAVDLLMAKPERAMMGMIVFFTGGFFHRPVARHRRIARADERITEWAGNIFEIIFGEKFSVEFDAQFIFQLLDGNSVIFIGAKTGSRERVNQKNKWKCFHRANLKGNSATAMKRKETVARSYFCVATSDVLRLRSNHDTIFRGVHDCELT